MKNPSNQKMFKRFFGKRIVKKLVFSSALLTTKETLEIRKIEPVSTPETLEVPDSKIIYKSYVNNVLTKIFLYLIQGAILYFLSGYFYLSLPSSILFSTAVELLNKKKKEIKKKKNLTATLIENVNGVLTGFEFSLLINFLVDSSFQNYSMYRDFHKIYVDFMYFDGILLGTTGKKFGEYLSEFTE
jgi:hypothetical protein